MLRLYLSLCLLLSLIACGGEPLPRTANELVFFETGPFKLNGTLRFPPGEGPFPVVLFIHGDGPNDRTSGGSYLPIMERMLHSGYAVFSWDKPGTGASIGEIDRSNLIADRVQIVHAARQAIAEHELIDPNHIGYWAISQGGFVMPRYFEYYPGTAFFICISCSGEPGVEQGAYIVASQAVCAGLPPEQKQSIKEIISAASRSQAYEDYVCAYSKLDGYPALADIDELGFRVGVRPESEWHADDLQGEYFKDPVESISQTDFPILAFFGELDTQVDPKQGTATYQQALLAVGNPLSKVVLLPGVDHTLVAAETGCLSEHKQRQRADWTNYSTEYLDSLESWLRSIQE
jgi:pimeloyl-ACP methyl ester carboxylesterase